MTLNGVYEAWQYNAEYCALMAQIVMLFCFAVRSIQKSIAGMGDPGAST
jgi:hypothetical protein